MNDLTIMGIKPLTNQIGEQFYPKTTTDAVFQPDSETGHATETTLTQILGAKADKVANATSGNFASLDNDGNLNDSGYAPSDFATSAQGALADTAYQKPSTGIPASDLASGVIPAPEVFVATVRTTTYQEISDALSDDKVVVMVDNNKTYYYTGIYNNRYTFFTFFGNNHYYALISIGSDNSWGIDSGAIELEFNKVFSLSSSSTDTQYPSAKCVYDTLLDYVQKSQTVGLLKNDGTVDTNTYLTQQDISGKADKANTPQIFTTTEINALTSEQCEEIKIGDIVVISSNGVDYTCTVATKTSNTLHMYYVYGDSKTLFKLKYQKANGTWSFAKRDIINLEIPQETVMPQSGGLKPNTLYTLGELVNNTTFNLNIAVNDEIANVWMWTFSIGSTAPMITWPNQITMWADGAAPTIEANKYYEVNVMNGLACVVSADIPQQQSND